MQTYRDPGVAWCPWESWESSLTLEERTNKACHSSSQCVELFSFFLAPNPAGGNLGKVITFLVATGSSGWRPENHYLNGKQD